MFERAAGNLSKYREQIARAEQRLAGLRKAEQDGNTLSEKQRETLAALSARQAPEQAAHARTRKTSGGGREMRKHGILLSGSSRTIESAVRRTQQYNEQLERERQALARVTQAQNRYEAAKAQAENCATQGLWRWRRVQAAYMRRSA